MTEPQQPIGVVVVVVLKAKTASCVWPHQQQLSTMRLVERALKYHYFASNVVRLRLLANYAVGAVLVAAKCQHPS